MEDKTYTTIFDKAKAAHGTGAYDDATLEFLFPDLKVSEDERIKKIITDSVFFQYGAGVEYKDVLDYLDKLEKQKEQKPIDPCDASWDAYYQRGYERGLEVGRKEQKPTWSEEDEKMIERLITRLNWITYNTRTDGTLPNITFFDEIDWLKSLRPVSKDSLQSWKPSEAHLSALLAVFNDPNNIGSQTCQLALTDLYEQLNKL